MAFFDNIPYSRGLFRGDPGSRGKNLHMSLCFSPVGDAMRNRARKFPALVNCTLEMRDVNFCFFSEVRLKHLPSGKQT